eukprot:1162811-Rhodomonas_salina.2
MSMTARSTIISTELYVPHRSASSYTCHASGACQDRGKSEISFTPFALPAGFYHGSVPHSSRCFRVSPSQSESPSAVVAARMRLRSERMIGIARSSWSRAVPEHDLDAQV